MSSEGGPSGGPSPESHPPESRPVHAHPPDATRERATRERATRARVRRAVIAAVVVDAALIGGFAALGRRTHERGVLGEYGLGLATTAWPFLVGAAVGWLVTRAWTSPLHPLRSGVGIWLVCVAGGMLLRAASAQGTDPAFVVVAAATLALALVGWRVVVFYLTAAGVSRPDAGTVAPPRSSPR